MKKLSILILILFLLTGCIKIQIENVEGGTANTKTKSDSRSELNNSIQTKIPLKNLKITELEDYNKLNATWYDKSNIIIMACKYNIPVNSQGKPEPDKTNWGNHRYEFYKYNLTNDNLILLFEYPMDGRPPFLYIKTLNDGTIAFKTCKKLVLYSIEDNKIFFEYQYPIDALVGNLIEISPDGTQVVYLDNRRGANVIIDNISKSNSAKKEIKTINVKGVTYLNYPMCSKDGNYILLYSSVGGEGINAATVLNISENWYKTFNFQEPYNEYFARVYWSNASNDYFLKFDTTIDEKIFIDKYIINSGQVEPLILPDYIRNLTSVSTNISSNSPILILFNNKLLGNDEALSHVVAYNFNNNRYCESEVLKGYGPEIVPVISDETNSAIMFYRKKINNDELPKWNIGIFDFSIII